MTPPFWTKHQFLLPLPMAHKLSHISSCPSMCCNLISPPPYQSSVTIWCIPTHQSPEVMTILSTKPVWLPSHPLLLLSLCTLRLPCPVFPILLYLAPLPLLTAPSCHHGKRYFPSLTSLSLQSCPYPDGIKTPPKCSLCLVFWLYGSKLILERELNWA